MTTQFIIAKQSKKALEDCLDIADKALKAFDSYGKSEMGMTPDHVKAMPEWQAAKKDFDQAFAQLRNFNGWYVKTFKKEIAQERKEKYKQA
jgi:hypothetical protein